MENEDMWKSWEEAYEKAKAEVKELPVVVAAGKKGLCGIKPIVYIDVPVKGNKTLIDKLISMGWKKNRGINVQGKRITEFQKKY